MYTEGGVVQLDDGHPHGAAELEVYQRVDVCEGGLPGDVREYGVLEQRGEHGLQLRLLGLAALRTISAAEVEQQWGRRRQARPELERGERVPEAEADIWAPHRPPPPPPPRGPNLFVRCTRRRSRRASGLLRLQPAAPPPHPRRFLISLALPEAPGLHLLLHFTQPIQAEVPRKQPPSQPPSLAG
ncbi:hypothetical protein U9M48_034178 [Paspalum notatum var. saurae]|uniref:Uncharacterized protein n=1 Tax=Paspalum notatum var. saurae TaxID=547442 RepID=A0AAQ3UA07_PASNO